MKFEEDLISDDNLQILKTKSVNKISDTKVVISAITWKSWLHVRPSNVLAMELNKLKEKCPSSFSIIFINKETNTPLLINWAMDILALWLRVNTNFDIMLEWEDISDNLITDLTNILNWLETHSIAWCESVPTAINRILWRNLL